MITSSSRTPVIHVSSRGRLVAAEEEDPQQVERGDDDDGAGAEGVEIAEDPAELDAVDDQADAVPRVVRRRDVVESSARRRSPPGRRAAQQERAQREEPADACGSGSSSRWCLAVQPIPGAMVQPVQGRVEGHGHVAGPQPSSTNTRDPSTGSGGISPRGAGPPATWPSGVNRPPWQGHLNARSPSCQATRQPRWVHTADSALTCSPCRTR